MTRRLGIVLFSVSIVFTAVVAAPCTGGVACAMARAHMDCCDGVSAGISAPRCCNGPQQVSRNATPVTAERPMQSSLAVPTWYAAPVALAHTSPARTLRPLGTSPGTAPPGGTLIAQHTSLLL